MAVYLGLLKPHDRIMGLDLPRKSFNSWFLHTKRRRFQLKFLKVFLTKFSEGLIDYDSWERHVIINHR